MRKNTENSRPVRAALRRMMDDPELFRRWAVAVANLEGWNCQHQPDEAARRLRRVMNSGHRAGHAPRNLDADWALMAIGIADVDEVTPLFARAAVVAVAVRERAASAA